MDPISIVEVKISEDEKKACLEVLDSGMLIEGQKVREFEKAFSEKTGANHAIAVSSGTAALHLCYLSMLEPGDEVIVPAFTFIATASMAALTGAVPVFCDIDPETLQLDISQVERLITPKTKAIVGVHLFGNSCDIEGLQKLAREHDLKLIWDAAQALGTTYQDRHVAQFADAACFSFYPSKNMTTGEGGMITTDDDKLALKLSRIKNHGRTEKYFHEYLGLNYRMTNISGAIGSLQLKKLDKFLARRRQIAQIWDKGFSQFQAIKLQQTTQNCLHSYNYYCLVLNTEIMSVSRDGFANELKLRGIPTAIHYPLSLHDQPCFSAFRRESLPISEAYAKQIIALPMHPYLKDDQVDFVLKQVSELTRDVLG